jgi:hypothetical protein
LYLKRIRSNDGYRYIIRITYREKELWKSRDLFDLGPSPEAFIHYTDGNGFYYTPDIESALESSGVGYSSDDLDELFMPFLRPETRYVLERSRPIAATNRFSKACAREQLPKFQQELHAFDIRRLHYLKFGHMDMGNIETDKSWKFLKILSCKCRDEIEATFDEMEHELPKREITSYIYTALNLQNHFPHHILRNHPVGLNLEEIDTHFLREICRLNLDNHFFRGVENPGNGVLHPYLAKYVWLYFDHSFESEEPWDEFLREFVQRRKFFRATPAAPSLTVRDACAAFGISREEFGKMTRKDLLRLYRKKAKRKHPDKGGDHDAFVRLTEAYEVLMKAKSRLPVAT